jgi:hypothetical protein
LPLVISATGIVPQFLYKNLKILDLGNTLVVEIQKGILLYSCHIVRKFLNIDTEHNKTQQNQNDEIPAFEFKLTANKSHDSTDVGTVSDR